MKKMILFIFLVFLVVSCKKNENLEGLKRYTNKEYNFTFLYPENCNLFNESNKIILHDYIIQITYHKNNMIGLYSEKEVDNLIDNIDKDIKMKKFPKLPPIQPSDSFEFRKKGKVYLLTDFCKGYEYFDGIIARRIIFVRNSELIIIEIAYYFEEPKDQQDKNNIKYKLQYTDEVPDELNLLNEYFDTIYSSLKFN